jgi:hypothetical protein
MLGSDRDRGPSWLDRPANELSRPRVGSDVRPGVARPPGYVLVLRYPQFKNSTTGIRTDPAAC